MSAADPFDLKVVVATPTAAQQADGAASWTLTRTLLTKVTCRSCTCVSCITQCPLSCW